MNTFGKITTNRVKLTQYLAHFAHNKQGEEILLAPRPRPGSLGASYYAIMRFPTNSANKKFFSSLKNYKPLTESEFEKEQTALGPFWEA